MTNIKVMCFGTFDGLHLGHLSYFKQAKVLGDYLIVIVARDKTVQKIKNKLPIQNEKTRLKNIKKIKIINQAVLGQLKNKFEIIKKYNPDIICLGYDQEVDLKELRKIFKKQIIRLKPYKKHIYKSSLLRIL